MIVIAEPSDQSPLRYHCFHGNIREVRTLIESSTADLSSTLPFKTLKRDLICRYLQDPVKAKRSAECYLLVANHVRRSIERSSDREKCNRDSRYEIRETIRVNGKEINVEKPGYYLKVVSLTDFLFNIDQYNLKEYVEITGRGKREDAWLYLDMTRRNNRHRCVELHPHDDILGMFIALHAGENTEVMKGIQRHCFDQYRGFDVPDGVVVGIEHRFNGVPEWMERLRKIRKRIGFYQVVHSISEIDEIVRCYE